MATPNDPMVLDFDAATGTSVVRPMTAQELEQAAADAAAAPEHPGATP